MKNQHFFLCFRMVSRLNFHLPVVVVFMYGIIENIVSVGILTAIYPLASAIMIGVLSKYEFNGNHLILLGEASKFIGLIIVITEHTYLTIFLFQMLSGIGHGASISGESELTVQNSDSSVSKSQTKAFVLVYLIFAVSGVAGVFLFLNNPIYPFAASMVTNVISFAVISTVRFQRVEDTSKSIMREKIDFRLVKEAIEFVFFRAIPLAIFVFLMPIKLFFIMNLSIYWISAFLICFTWAGAISGMLVGQNFTLFRRIIIYTIIIVVHIFASISMLLSQNLWTLLTCAIILGSSSAVSRPLAAHRIETKMKSASNEMVIRLINNFELGSSGLIAITNVGLAYYLLWVHGHIISN